MSDLAKRLAMASCTLLAGMDAAANDWEVDTSYLSYTEMDERVSVAKTMADLTRNLEDGTVTVNLIHDTMSGASPTGALRGPNAAVTYTGASGGSGFSAGKRGDGSLSTFEDTRIQAGISRDAELSRLTRYSYGAVISQEDDYESLGGNIGIQKDNADRRVTYSGGIALTTDSIYRSGSGTTPDPLGSTSIGTELGEGNRNTIDTLVGFSRVLNRRTVIQLNVSASLSNGYHTDPYKVVSAADAEGVVVANVHESRPGSRLRTSIYSKFAHQVVGTDHSLHMAYRLYQDDWGIQSHTVDMRYRVPVGKRQSIEPHVRFYRQSQADFYKRSLGIDGFLDPVLPESGFASADYRLDGQTSYTLGMKYGFDITPKTSFRLRTEYIGKTFDNSEYSTNDAVVVQTSLRYRF